MRRFYCTLVFGLLSHLCLLGQSTPFNASELWLSGTETSRHVDPAESDTTPVSLFNFNPIVDIASSEAVYKNRLDEYFSVFAVFKTNGNADEQVFKLATRKHKIKVTSAFVDQDEAVAFDKSDPSQGVILSYMAKMKDYSRKNSISFKDFYKRIAKDPDNNQLVEVLYFPKILNPTERGKIESYLSIKYGISLLGEKNYITSQKDTIWSYKKNKDFIHNITGIGRDDRHALYQKQSSNVMNDVLSIGFDSIALSNVENEVELTDGTFLLWGDNNGSPQFKNNQANSIQKMDRIWKVQTSELEGVSEQKLEFRLDTQAMNFEVGTSKEETNIVWLAVQDTYGEAFDFPTATVYPQTTNENGVITFSDISWEVANKQSRYFTFFAAPAFFAQAEVASNNCLQTETTEVQLDFKGGQSPFQIEAVSSNGTASYATDEANYIFDLETGAYTLILTDDLGQVFETSIVIEKEEKPIVTLAPIWQLNTNGQVHVLPSITATDEAALQYAWYDGETVLSTTQQHTFRSEGTYAFEVTTSNGCQTRFPVEVTRDAIAVHGDSTLFPNPVDINQPFRLSLHLERPSEVTIRIFNASGQLINTDKLAATQDVNYQSTLSSSGTYFISVQTREMSTTFKLLVK
jgi:hypothetical protein